MDRHKALQVAERLLKQGKVREALSQLEKLAVSSRGDPITLNRMGDLLAKQGRKVEAIDYYYRIAEQFTTQGFFPKAVAIYKKLLRLEPDHTDALSRLGKVYLAQKLPGEARSYLLRAAEIHLAAENHQDAREIFVQLVKAEPDNPSHRARLAETRAAEGDAGSAAEELCRLGDSLCRREEHAEGEKAYRRALSLVDDNAAALVGVANCMAQAGNEDESLQLLETGLKDHGNPAILGELLVRQDAKEDHAAVERLLRHEGSGLMPIDCLKQLFDANRGRSPEALERLWERIGGAFDRWAGEDRPRVLELLDVLVSLEPSGHLPALERRLRYARDAGATERIVPALEGLIRAVRVRGGDASKYETQLQELMPGETPVGASGTAASAAQQSSKLPEDAEAPAVPLNKSDEEFVSGRLTQAEILEKYGLIEKAIEQLREVVNRFPGVLAAQEQLVSLLRAESHSSETVRDALVGLALARRAAGQHETAQQVATEAVIGGGLPEESEALLRRLGLVQGARDPVPTAPIVETREPRVEAKIEVAVEVADDDDDVVIDFDADEKEAEAPVVEIKTPAASPVQPVVGNGDDDLSAITAALENSMFSDEAESSPRPESEQSLESVFAAFREQVDKELDSDDFRTHYDLGIGYMEMGLLDEAVREFEVAMGSAELHRDACVMLALAHRSRQDSTLSIEWFRKALECQSDDASKVHELRYDLAEVLLDSGDVEGALGEFRRVLGANANFRDVRQRVEQLDSRQPS